MQPRRLRRSGNGRHRSEWGCGIVTEEMIREHDNAKYWYEQCQALRAQLSFLDDHLCVSDSARGLLFEIRWTGHANPDAEYDLTAAIKVGLAEAEDQRREADERDRS